MLDSDAPFLNSGQFHKNYYYICAEIFAKILHLIWKEKVKNTLIKIGLDES